MPTEISHINVQYDKTIGRGEQFGPGFNYPVFVARGQDDIMYVLCRGTEFRPEGVRVTVCTTDEEYVSTFARGINYQGPHEFNMEDGSLVWPTCIALDSQENLFISDEWLNRISSFSKDGDFLGKWEERTGSGDGELDRPSGMAFDADDNLYIVDSGNHRVQKFSKDGKFLFKFGTEGSGDGEFNMPWGITIDSHGDIFIADWRNDRIQKFSPDGQFLMKFGSSGSGEGQFDRPTGIAVDRDGVIYVADWLNNRLQVFDQDGKFVAEKTGEAGVSKWAKDKLDANAEMWGERERAQGLEREKDFWGPTGVTVDDQGRIFVPESARNRIQVYKTQSPTFAGPRL
ncbi:MAG: 6-bladed beta-propeller [SAR202 cluster bacterium]|nr:6-bladed beta-propeller [SAR202 cluster bacterium]